MLVEIRWHGRGGQGVVTAGRILAEAALLDGKYIQAFPEFGPERTGAPVRSFTRISDKPINLHSQIYNPDVVAVIDPTVLSPEVYRDIKMSGKLIVNSNRAPEELAGDIGCGSLKLYTVNAIRIALDILGRPIYNTPIIGALIKATGVASLDSVIKAVSQRFLSTLAERNIKAIVRAYDEVKGS
ncbi:MAG: 2-oxoacid:acceptor oxidoreductase family protein [Candidatus Bathyarchaeia archaeon]